jgi:hypothetical protein
MVARVEPATRKNKEKNRMKAAVEAPKKCRPSLDPHEDRINPTSGVDSAPRSQRDGNKKQNKKAGRKEGEERQRVRTLDGEIAEGKHCHSSDPREE